MSILNIALRAFFHLTTLIFIILSISTFLFVTPIFANEQVSFKAVTIANDFDSGYQVVAHDMNGDGMSDLIVLDSRFTELVWFENPKWERHVLADSMTRMINLTLCGGFLVVAQQFSNRVKDSTGEIVVIMADGSKRVIDRLPTSHRLRCADIDGSGNMVVINGPLTGVQAIAPEYQDHVPLVYYIPGEWKRRFINDENEGVQHGIYIYDWNGNGKDDILTASFSGIHYYSMNNEWIRTEIAKGYPGQWPQIGSSDIAIGQADGRYLAAIEPFHGHEVVVYRDGKRVAIDNTLDQGHTITTGDLNNDGKDEIIAGYRGNGQSVNIYYLENMFWKRTVLDDGDMAAASCTVADLNSDSLPDIACIGRATKNLKWYENQGQGLK
jgi:hypothetical protein